MSLASRRTSLPAVVHGLSALASGIWALASGLWALASGLWAPIASRTLATRPLARYPGSEHAGNSLPCRAHS